MYALISYLTAHFSLRVWPQRFARSVCLVTCAGYCKGQGVKVINDSSLHKEVRNLGSAPLHANTKGGEDPLQEVRNLGSA